MIFDLQKASLTKRLSAYILDFFIVVLLAVVFMVLIYDAVDYDSKANELTSYHVEYEEKYGIDSQLSVDEIALLPQAEQDKYAAAEVEWQADERVRNVYSDLINLILLNTAISLFLAYLICEFIVPLVLKNGQTVGKKVFNIAIMRVDGVKVSPLQLFVRGVIGKFTIETIIPLLLATMVLMQIMPAVAVVVLLLLLLLQIAVMIISKTNSAIHDLLAVTVAVDLESQRIFESEAAMLDYKLKLAADKASDAPY